MNTLDKILFRASKRKKSSRGSLTRLMKNKSEKEARQVKKAFRDAAKWIKSERQKREGKL